MLHPVSMFKNLQLLSLSKERLYHLTLWQIPILLLLCLKLLAFSSRQSVDTRVSGVHLRLSLGVNLFSETGTLWGGGWIFFNKWNYLRLGNSSLTRTDQPNPTEGKAGPVEI